MELIFGTDLFVIVEKRLFNTNLFFLFLSFLTISGELFFRNFKVDLVRIIYELTIFLNSVWACVGTYNLLKFEVSWETTLPSDY